MHDFIFIRLDKNWLRARCFKQADIPKKVVFTVFFLNRASEK